MKPRPVSAMAVLLALAFVGPALVFLAPTRAGSAGRDAGPQSIPAVTVPRGAALSPRPPCPQGLRFGLTPYLPTELLRREFQPIMAYLSEKLHMPVDLVIAATYEELGTWLEEKLVDIASFSPLAYVVEKRRNPSVRLLAGQIVGGATSFTAYLIVREDAKIHELEHLRGKTLAFVDRTSSSGYLFPYAFFLDHGVDPEHFFGRILFAGNHLEAIRCVLDRRADAAATYSEGLMTARHSGLDVRPVRIFKKTGMVPADAVCARGDLDPSLVQQVKTLLLGLDTVSEQGRAILGQTLRINGWVEVGDRHYDTVRAVLELVERHTGTQASAGMQ
jgi:phosphate/phosphite/phosphonate ABC transporter binding protein